MGGVSGLDLVLDVPCVVGKSMLLRRADLEEMGGFAFLGRHLAEDQVCGEETVARGRRVAVSGRPADNVLGRVGFRDYVRRHVRWARIRRRICPSGFAAEALLNPFFLSLVGLAAAPSARSAILAGGTLAFASALAASSERMLGVRRALPLYPVLEAARSVATGLLWFAPWFGSTVIWRGRRFRIGPRTRLEPLEGPAPAPAPGPAA